MYRTEYPRPQFIRQRWLCLNGSWQFAFDDKKVSLAEHWEQKKVTLPLTIEVPFCFESSLSGIGDTSPHDTIFYKRTFIVPKDWEGQQIILHFGAVDYRCQVFVNGKLAGTHEGGHVNFSFNITNLLLPDTEQELSVYVEDPYEDEAIPRGKQFWEKKSAGIWYTRTSGIWQTVWLEPVNTVHIEHLKMSTDIEQGTLLIDAEFSDAFHGLVLQTEITFQGQLIASDSYSITERQCFHRTVHITGDKIFHGYVHDAKRLWSPENPALYDITFVLKDESRIYDEVKSYFGMRKIHTENGMTYLNNRPYYFKLVLDQGYFEEGIMTAPSIEDFKKDIELSKEMGFNGCRKHQKAEDPIFLSLADKLGFLVWGEMASASIYTEKANIRYTKEWTELIQRDYNHPCIVTWVPFNESWGVPDVNRSKQQQAHTLALYYLIKSLDSTRLVIGNDGWELTKTDICAIHNYSHGTATDEKKRIFFTHSMNELPLLLSPAPAGRNIFANGFSYEGQPILITECGGIHYNTSDSKGWGYTSANGLDDYLEQYKFVIETILSSEKIFGFCYTQLTDVEQETNGLLTCDRKPKCDLSKIKEINEAFHHNIALVSDCK